jgi:hypothetical protein
LVSENNKSDYSDELIMCQIFKETSFDPNAHIFDQYKIKHVGLMQMGQPAITDVNNYVKKQKLTGVPTFSLSDMSDPAKAIQAGTLYLKMLADQDAKRGLTGTLNRFGTGKGYADSILNCANCLKMKKLSCEDCLRLTHPPKKRKKPKKVMNPKKSRAKTLGVV